MSKLKEELATILNIVSEGELIEQRVASIVKGVTGWEDVINLTPHAIKVYTSDGVKEIPPSGEIVRLTEQTQKMGQLLGVPLVRVKMGAPRLSSNVLSKGKVFIVSEIARPILQKKYRKYLFVSPDTGPNSAVRDESGRIIGVKRFRC